MLRTKESPGPAAPERAAQPKEPTMTVSILTLNEESNIRACIESLSMFERSAITIWDGGSVDRTREIAAEMGVNVEHHAGTSPATRCAMTLDTDAEFVMHVDADQRLVSNPRLIMEREFADPAVAGVQFAKRASKDSEGYWSRGFGQRMEWVAGVAGPSYVIGTPCIWRLSAARAVGNYDASITGSTNDTDFCLRLRKGGYKVIIIPETAEERFRDGFRGTVGKAYWYGCGDAEFVRNSKPLDTRHIYHVLVRNLLLLPARALLRAPTLFPFFAVFGIARASGFVRNTLFPQDMTNTKS